MHFVKFFNFALEKNFDKFFFFFITLGKNINRKLHNRPNDYEVEEWRDSGKY